MDDFNCKDIIYSEEYIEFIIDYRENAGYELTSYFDNCIQQISDNYIVAYANTSSFNNLLLRGGYRTIPKCYGLLDTQVLEETGVLQLRRQPFIDLYGQDVIFGLVDCGIDYRSSAFTWQNNKTRIVAAWNQEDTAGPPPEGFLYGTEYSGNAINEALNNNENYSYIDSLIDANGHGTAMASVAAGAIIEENDFSGLAPLCDIAVVKLRPAKQFYRDYYLINDTADAFMENDIMLGIKYLLETSVRLSKPIVICLGLGTNLGDHNGSGHLGEYLNTIATLPGIYICAAAGNETGNAHHFQGNSLQTGEYQDIEIVVSEDNAANNKGFVAELWADTASFFSLRIKPPIGSFSGIVDARSRQIREFNFDLAGSRAEVFSELIEKSTGDQLIFIRIITPAPGVWTLRVIQDNNNNGSFNMWLPINNFLYTETIFLGASPDVTICEPANTQNIITFAASSVNGNRIYVNSSRGYTRSGRVKPDLTAPGEDVFTIIGVANGENRYTNRSGTSIASAVGSGLLLLFAEWSILKSPTNSVAAKQYLIRGADTTGISIPDKNWGWGRANIYDTFINISE